MIKELKYIAYVQMGLTFRSRLEPISDGNVAVIQMKNLSADNRLDSENLTLIEMQKLKEHHMVRQNDLIFRARGINNTAILVDREVKHTVVAAPLLLVLVSASSILPGYLCWFINLPLSQAFLQSHATGTAMRMIGKRALDALEVLIPSLSTQQCIIELSRLVDREQSLYTSLSDRRKLLVDNILMRAISTSRHS